MGAAADALESQTSQRPWFPFLKRAYVTPCIETINFWLICSTLQLPASEENVTFAPSNQPPPRLFASAFFLGRRLPRC